ncbi:glycerol-3-phosphate 1-O-acyltransferase PlsB [Pseudoalteromonas sp. T1lg65]|uniref:glycerol-3-phosphate 1-O-acyltransferase PlsB n=1 Tax=Pseudoalteromonas sp. T1lg65 TaxID=2077101 RepID=UPI003F790172
MRVFSYLLTTLARWSNHIFVKTKVLPANPIESYGLNPELPTFYLTRLNSASDLAALDNMCKQLGLPAASKKEKLGNIELDRFVAIQNPPSVFSDKSRPSDAIEKSKAIFEALNADATLQAQVIPITILWGRNPGKEKPGVGTLLSSSLTPSWLRKCFVVLFSGRDTFVRFSQPIELRTLLNDKADVDALPHKLLRVARVHFRRQKLTATGPKLPSREKLFNSILAAPSIKKAIADEAKAKGLSHQEARLEALELLDEIAANYSDAMVRVADRALTWLWNKLYNGIEVNNSDKVRELADKGHEIIYVPCHRSHMDYLLLTYVIYHQGLVPPHIAAGVNLNFFPAGPIFRRSGAFFIRRSFSGNKLYSAIFKEYLTQLFIKGYSVKFYTEGGRSRTGRLLPPKTGMLAMTLQSMLRGIDRPVTVVPVYLGYEHVMEINTYLKELAGSSKKKESVLGIFKAIKNLKNYGRGYLNFGEPICLNQYLNQHQPNWRDAISKTDSAKPSWLNTQVANLADDIMTEINNSAALNAVNLLATILLNNEQFALSKSLLLKQLSLYQGLHRQAPYHKNVTVPEGSAEELLTHALKLDKFDIVEDGFGEIISIKEKERALMTYYINNTLHLFALPSLLAQQLFNRYSITVEESRKQVEVLYPLFANEWFLTPLKPNYIDDVFRYFAEQGLITYDGHVAMVNKDSEVLSQLEMLGKVLHLTLERYAITINLVKHYKGMTRSELEKTSTDLATRLGTLHGIKSPEFFDKKVLTAFVTSLKEQGYIQHSESTGMQATDALIELEKHLQELLPARIHQSIQNIL